MHAPACHIEPSAAPSRAAVIAAELAKWPPACVFGPRAAFDASAHLAELPRDPARREAAAIAKAAAAREEAARDCDRYDQIRTSGAKVLSAYDLSIAYGGDNLAAVRGSLHLKHAHITYQRSLAVIYDATAIEARAAATGDARQVPLF